MRPIAETRGELGYFNYISSYVTRILKVEMNNRFYAVESITVNRMALIIRVEGSQNAPICCTPYWNTHN